VGVLLNNYRNITETSEYRKLNRTGIKVLVQEPPGIGVVILGTIFLLIALFMFLDSDAEIGGGILAGILGIVCIYTYIDYKSHPDSEKYVSEEKLIRWKEMISADSVEVRELKKTSQSVLIELKKKTLIYYNDFLLASTLEEESCAHLLLDCQQQIVDLSEFVVLKNDEPQKDLDKYTALISTNRYTFKVRGVTYPCLLDKTTNRQEVLKNCADVSDFTTFSYYLKEYKYNERPAYMIVCKEQGLDIGVVPSDFTETVLNYKNNKTKLECIVLDSFYKNEKETYFAKMLFLAYLK